MLKVRLLLVLLLATLAASAQYDPTKLTRYRYRAGIWENAIKADSVLAPPQDTTYSKTGLALKNGVFYVGNGTYWSEVTGGGSSITTADYGYLNVKRDFGAAGDGVADDADNFQAMFDWIENNPATTYKLLIPAGNYKFNSTVQLPQRINSSTNSPRVSIEGYGARLFTTNAIAIFERLPATQTIALDSLISNWIPTFRGLTFEGNQTTGQVGLRIGATYSMNIEDCIFDLLDTGMVSVFGLQATIKNCRFPRNKTTGLYLGFGERWGGTDANSASNSNLVENCQVSGTSGQYAHLHAEAANGLIVRNFISEGAKPQYNFVIDSRGSTTVKYTDISDVHVESSGGVYSSNTVFKIRAGGTVHIRNVFLQYADTLFNSTNSASSSHIIFEGIPYIGALPAVAFNANGVQSTPYFITFKNISDGQTFKTKLFNTASWVGGVVPISLYYQYEKAGSSGTLAVSPGGTIDLEPGASSSPKAVNIYGHLFFPTDSTYSIGGEYGLYNRRPKDFFIGNDLYIGKAGSIGFGDKDGKDVDIIRAAAASLHLTDGSTGFSDLKLKVGTFTQPSGYDTNFVLTQVTDSSFVTKSMLEDAVASVSGDNWGTQRVVGDSTLSGGGTEATDDSLRVNLDIVAGKTWVRDTIAAIGAATGDEWGDQDAVTDNYTLKGNGDETPLRTDTTVIIPWSAWDSLKLSVPGSDKFPTIDSTDNAPLGTGSNTFPTSAAVRAAIDAAVVQSGTTLTGWYNLLEIGGVSDAGFGTGTNNDDAWTYFVNNAPEGSMLYIPRGKYRFNSPLAIPSGKRLYIWQEGDIYVNSGNGYLVDGTSNRLWIHGKILGTNQDITTPTYNSQTNYGIWLRNGGYNQVYVNEIFGFKYAIQLGGYATGSSTVQGQQYSTVHFSFLRRNSVGIYHHPDGGTTNSRGNWANQNYIFGGRIAGDTGIVFRPDVTQDDQFNGNYHYNIGFEGAYTGASMKVGIYGEFGRNNVWFGWRFESCDDPFVFTNNFDNSQFIGGIIPVDELHSPGNNTTFLCELYEPVNGITVGTRGQGYTYNASNTFYNGRVRVWGTRLSPSVASALPANIDVEWEVETDASVTGSSYTVAKGVSTVLVNYTSGTSTITLPAAASFPNRKITIKNIHASNTVTVSGPTTGQTTSLSGNMAATYESSGTAWYDISQKPAGSGDGIFDADATGYTTPNKIGVGGSNSSSSTALRVPGGTTTVSPFRIPNGFHPTSPADGDEWRVAKARYMAYNGITYQYLTVPDNGSARQIVRRNAANDDYEHAYASASLGRYRKVSNTDLTVTDQDYAVFIGGQTATRTLTLPDPASYPDRVLIIGQATGNGSSVSLSRTIYDASDTGTNSILNNNKFMIQSDGTVWRIIMERL
jgi:hypothetical protein